MIGGVLGVVDARERKCRQRYGLGGVDDRWRYVRQGFEISSGAGCFGLCISRNDKSGGGGEREREESAECSHWVLGRGEWNRFDSTEVPCRRAGSGCPGKSRHSSICNL